MSERAVSLSGEERVRRQTIEGLFSVIPGLHTHPKYNELVRREADTGRLEFWEDADYIWLADLGGSNDYLVDVMKREMPYAGGRPVGPVYMVTQIKLIN